MERNSEHKNFNVDSLKNDKVAEAYFNAVLEDCQSLSEDETQKHLVIAFKNIAAAHGKLGKWIVDSNFAESMMAGVAKLIYKAKT